MKLLLSSYSLSKTWSLSRARLGYCCGVRYNCHTSFHPLRVLFCGSDEFSAASLEKLYAEHARDPSFIASIDVVCKTGKPSGRGLKHILPIKSVVEKLKLPLHEISTFTGWQPPTGEDGCFSLVIAVSFGLLVPPRILNFAKYGGVNLHPSLLPELRGPAPLQHTLLQGLKRTGITLQTLHPRQFDHGTIIAQDSFDLPELAKISLTNLRDLMSLRAANLLIASLRDGLFVPPIKAKERPRELTASHAPRIQSKDSRIDWETWSSDRILRTQRAIGPLWNEWVYQDSAMQKRTRRSQRILWHDFKKYANVRESVEEASLPGMPSIHFARAGAMDAQMKTTDSSTQVGGIWTSDGCFLSPTSVTIEGRKKGWPGDSAQTMKYLLGLAGLATSGQPPTVHDLDTPILC